MVRLLTLSNLARSSTVSSCSIGGEFIGGFMMAAGQVVLWERFCFLSLFIDYYTFVHIFKMKKPEKQNLETNGNKWQPEAGNVMGEERENGGI